MIVMTDAAGATEKETVIAVTGEETEIVIGIADARIEIGIVTGIVDARIEIEIATEIADAETNHV